MRGVSRTACSWLRRNLSLNSLPYAAVSQDGYCPRFLNYVPCPSPWRKRSQFKQSRMELLANLTSSSWNRESAATCGSRSIFLTDSRPARNLIRSESESSPGPISDESRDTYNLAGDSTRSGVAKSSRESARRDGRSIPSFFKRCIRVVRFKPNFMAAPFGPPIFQPLACSA